MNTFARTRVKRAPRKHLLFVATVMYSNVSLIARDVDVYDDTDILVLEILPQHLRDRRLDEATTPSIIMNTIHLFNETIRWCQMKKKTPRGMPCISLIVPVFESTLGVLLHIKSYLWIVTIDKEFERSAVISAMTSIIATNKDMLSTRLTEDNLSSTTLDRINIWDPVNHAHKPKTAGKPKLGHATSIRDFLVEGEITPAELDYIADRDPEDRNYTTQDMELVWDKVKTRHSPFVRGTQRLKKIGVEGCEIITDVVSDFIRLFEMGSGHNCDDLKLLDMDAFFDTSSNRFQLRNNNMFVKIFDRLKTSFLTNFYTKLFTIVRREEDGRVVEFTRINTSCIFAFDIPSGYLHVSGHTTYFHHHSFPSACLRDSVVQSLHSNGLTKKNLVYSERDLWFMIPKLESMCAVENPCWKDMTSATSDGPLYEAIYKIKCEFQSVVTTLATLTHERSRMLTFHISRSKQISKLLKSMQSKTLPRSMRWLQCGFFIDQQFMDSKMSVTGYPELLRELYYDTSNSECQSAVFGWSRETDTQYLSYAKATGCITTSNVVYGGVLLHRHSVCVGLSRLIVLICGPTGTGKTTAAKASILLLKNPSLGFAVNNVVSMVNTTSAQANVYAPDDENSLGTMFTDECNIPELDSTDPKINATKREVSSGVSSRTTVIYNDGKPEAVTFKAKVDFNKYWTSNSTLHKHPALLSRSLTVIVPSQKSRGTRPFRQIPPTDKSQAREIVFLKYTSIVFAALECDMRDQVEGYIEDCVICGCKIVIQDVLHKRKLSVPSDREMDRIIDFAKLIAVQRAIAEVLNMIAIDKQSVVWFCRITENNIHSFNYLCKMQQRRLMTMCVTEIVEEILGRYVLLPRDILKSLNLMFDYVGIGQTMLRSIIHNTPIAGYQPKPDTVCLNPHTTELTACLPDNAVMLMPFMNGIQYKRESAATYESKHRTLKINRHYCALVHFAEEEQRFSQLTNLVKLKLRTRQYAFRISEVDSDDRFFAFSLKSSRMKSGYIEGMTTNTVNIPPSFNYALFDVFRDVFAQKALMPGDGSEDSDYVHITDNFFAGHLRDLKPGSTVEDVLCLEYERIVVPSQIHTDNSTFVYIEAFRATGKWSFEEKYAIASDKSNFYKGYIKVPRMRTITDIPVGYNTDLLWEKIKRSVYGETNDTPPQCHWALFYSSSHEIESYKESVSLRETCEDINARMCCFPGGVVGDFYVVDKTFLGAHKNNLRGCLKAIDTDKGKMRWCLANRSHVHQYTREPLQEGDKCLHYNQLAKQCFDDAFLYGFNVHDDHYGRMLYYKHLCSNGFRFDANQETTFLENKYIQLPTAKTMKDGNYQKYKAELYRRIVTHT